MHQKQRDQYAIAQRRRIIQLLEEIADAEPRRWCHQCESYVGEDNHDCLGEEPDEATDDEGEDEGEDEDGDESEGEGGDEDETGTDEGDAVAEMPLDPGDHTVAELEQALDDADYGPSELEAIRDAEASGKNRATALGALDDALESED